MCVRARICVGIYPLFLRKMKEQSFFIILGYYLGLDLVTIPFFLSTLSFLPSKLGASALKGGVAKVSLR